MTKNDLTRNIKNQLFRKGCLGILIVSLCACVVSSLFIGRSLLDGIGFLIYQKGESDYDQRAYAQAMTELTVSKNIFRLTNNSEWLAVSLIDLGRTQTELGEYKIAMLSLEDALSICQEIKSKECEFDTLNELSVLSIYIGKFDDVIIYSAQALSLYSDLARPYHNLGMAYMYKGDFNNAIENFERAAGIYSKGGYGFDEQIELGMIAHSYELWGNIKLADDYYHKQLEIIKTNGITREQNVLTDLGLMYERVGQYEKALDYHNQALEINYQKGHPQQIAETLENIGGLYILLGNYDAASQYTNEALKITEQYHYSSEQITALINLAAISRNLGDYDQALRYYFQCLALAEAINDEYYQADLYHNIGSLYYSIGDVDKALENYKKSSALFDKFQSSGRPGTTGAGQPDTLAPVVHIDLGNVYNSEHQNELALTEYQKALSISQSKNDVYGTIVAYVPIGSVYFDMGQNDMAKYYFDLALELNPQDAIASMNSFILEASISRQVGNYEMALSYIDHALSIARQTGDQQIVADILFNQADLLQEQGKNDEAIEILEQALGIKNATYRKLALYETKSILNSSLAPHYESLVSLLWEAGRYEEAYHYSEQARARAFLDDLSRGPIDLTLGASKDLLDNERSLNAEIASLNEEFNILESQPIDQQDPNTILAVKKQLSQKQKEYADLLIQIKLQSPQIFSLVSAEIPTLSEIQTQLDADTTLVEYFVTDSNTYIFIIARNAFDTTKIDVGRSKLADTIMSFRAFPSLGNEHSLDLEQLYGWLIAPVKDKINTKNAGIVPYSVLHYLPFSALTDGNRYLVDDYTLFALPSASSLLFIMDKPKVETSNILLLGNPQPAEPLPALQFASQEVQQIAAIYPSDLYLGKKATETILKQKVDEAKFLHIAAHSELNSINPLFSSIILTPDGYNDGRLQVCEIYQLDLSKTTNLVVLSACQTQIGQLSTGDEVVGLTRAFIYAGSLSVVSSSWNVNDESTSMLMTAFYTYLKSGMTKAGALQLAQLDVRTKYPNPYYWAAYILTGNPN